MSPTIHILPKGMEGWLLKTVGLKGKEGFFDTREEALRAAEAMADTFRADLVVHERDGTTTRH